MKKIEQILAENVVKKRKSLNMSQLELSNLSKVSITTVNRLEKMKQVPQASNLEAIAKVLRTTREELFKDTSQVSPTIDSLTKIIERQENEIELLRVKDPLAKKLFENVPIDILELLVTGKPSWAALRAVLGVNPINVKPKKNQA